MGRGRRKATRLTITKKDETALRCMAKAGIVTTRLATEVIGMGKNRLRRLEKEGYVESKRDPNESYYVLTTKGKTYAKTLEGVKNLYNHRSYIHDCKMATYFLRLDAQQQKDAMTERDITDRWGKPSDRFGERELFSPPDLIVPKYAVRQGHREVVGVEHILEVVTDNYGRLMIEAKENYVSQIIGEVDIEITYEVAR